jgi:hypothetical protein
MEHCDGKKLRVDKQIDIVGREACTLTLIHEGRYSNTRAFDDGEMSYIQAFREAELLNEKHVITNAEKERAEKLAAEASIPLTAKNALGLVCP